MRPVKIIYIDRQNRRNDGEKFDLSIDAHRIIVDEFNITRKKPSIELKQAFHSPGVLEG